MGKQSRVVLCFIALDDKLTKDDNKIPLYVLYVGHLYVGLKYKNRNTTTL